MVLFWANNLRTTASFPEMYPVDIEAVFIVICGKYTNETSLAFGIELLIHSVALVFPVAVTIAHGSGPHASSTVNSQLHQHEHQTPTFQHEPPARMSFSNDSGAQLYCAAHGIPPPLVTWVLKDGTPVSTLAGLRQMPGNGTLYFPPFAGPYYRGDVHETVYRCRVSNVAGTILSRDVHVHAGKIAQ